MTDKEYVPKPGDICKVGNVGLVIWCYKDTYNEAPLRALWLSNTSNPAGFLNEATSVGVDRNEDYTFVCNINLQEFESSINKAFNLVYNK